MIINFLGTGTSTGVPEIGCTCKVCKSTDIRDSRLRSSVQIKVGNKNILIDCTPDFRQQSMRIPFEPIDGILITHEHYDHVSGIDDLRPYSRHGTINLYAEANVEAALRTKIPYCFSEIKYKGVPDIELHRISYTEPFHIGEVEIIPIRVVHYRLPILGFRIGNFAYLTDVKTIPIKEFIKLKGLDVLVINALRIDDHTSHLNLSQAIDLVETSIIPKTTYFTHMSHQIGLHSEISKTLPKNMHFAYDNLQITIDD